VQFVDCGNCELSVDLKDIYSPFNVFSNELFETICFTVKICGLTSNFVVSDKPPKTEIHEYLTHMDEVLSNLRLADSTFVIGDLNVDLRSIAGRQSVNLMDTYGFANVIEVPTRTNTIMVNNI
jgi:hypothetical protein